MSTGSSPELLNHEKDAQYVLALASRLIIQLPRPLPAVMKRLSLYDRVGAEARVPAKQVLWFHHQGSGSSKSCLCIDVLDLLEIEVGSVNLVQLEFADGATIEMTAKVHTIQDKQIDADLISLIRDAVEAGAIDPRIGSVFDRSCRWHGADALGHHSFDTATAGTGATLIEGWIENVRSRAISFMTTDFRAFCSREDTRTFYRGDVVSHLAKLPESRALNDDHGFMAMLPGADYATSRSLYVLETGSAGTSVYGPVTVAATGDRARALASLESRLDLGDDTPAVAARFISPFIRKPRTASKIIIKSYGPPADDALVSIVVPLTSAKPVFFQSHLLNQTEARGGLEWIFVGNIDWDVSAFMRQQVEIACPTTIIAVAGTSSTASALTLAAQTARGTYLLILPEAAWIDDFPALYAHASQIAELDISVVGLQGELEDGSSANAVWVWDDTAGHTKLDHIKPNSVSSLTTKRDITSLPDGYFISIYGMLVERRLTIEVGFDERIISDLALSTDFCRRAGKLGPFFVAVAPWLRSASSESVAASPLGILSTWLDGVLLERGAQI